jgi:hypothetical protein
MATQYYYFSGTAKWAQLTRTNKFGKHSINLYVDDKTRKEIRGLGTRLNAKEDDDGFFFNFRRDPDRTFPDGSKLGPPTVVDKDGNPLTALVGNGSKVTVKIAVYDFPAGEKDGEKWASGRGTRLEAVRVDELVPYEADTSDDAPKGGNVIGVPF